VRSDLAVVIVTYNSEHVIAGLLDTLPAALDGLRADVVVVDNGSTDNTATLVEARDDCRLIRETNRGYAAGINAGVRGAGDVPAVLVLNPDLRMSPRSVGPLLESAMRPGVGIVAPKVLDDNGELFFSLRREPTLRRALGLNRTRLASLSEYVNRPEAYREAHAVDWALGAALLVTAQCTAAVGPWDESYFLYSEETDYCLRARKAGYSTYYEPRSVVSHIGGQSGQSPQIHSMQILNRVRLYARSHSTAAGWAYLVATVLSEWSWVLRGSAEARFTVRALLQPSARPPVLGLAGTRLPK
jgi:N-acetylglucosaminyl-diphospho-decaprenol L-rhamnosyltransferase